MTGNATDLHDFLLEYGLQYSPRLVWELTLTGKIITKMYYGIRITLSRFVSKMKMKLDNKDRIILWTDEFTELIRQPEATILGVISTLNWLSEGMIDKFFISAYIPCYDIYLIGLKSDEKQTRKMMISSKRNILVLTKACLSATRIMVTEQSESEPYLGLDVM